MTPSFELLSKDDLLFAAIATKRPVSFLVGSPLSLKDGVGVPDVSGVLDLVKAEIQERVAIALPKFEAALAGKTWGDAYQEAMKLLGRWGGQDALNAVILKAVLKARNSKAPELPTGDGSPEDWDIPAGTAGLGKLVAGGNERFLGPILTTNFDPLISLAIRQAGGRSGRRVLTTDGTLAGAAEDDPGICSVVHLHGYWRDSETLHTPTQLTSARPKLAKSLQRLLQRRTLVVAAYGGWDDAFTLALADLMNDEQAPLDVIWCFYESDPDQIQQRYRKLLAAVQPAIVMNRFRAFGGIDCHSIFDEILETLREMSQAKAVPASGSPIAGWELIDAAYLGVLPPLSREEVVRYFDGATPTLRHAACADIPPREAVSEIKQRFEAARIRKTGCSLQLIRAAGGEGKTTILLQTAVAAARDDGWNILWRSTSRVGMPPEHIVKLDAAKDWLIVADDAENLVSDLTESARLLHEAGRSNVHFLIAARDTDWSHAKGDRQILATSLTVHRDALLRELTKNDATMLIGAWHKFGAEGLRALESLHEPEQQAAELMAAVRDSGHAPGDGSFFGGLLTVRFGADGLQSHVVTLLNRLKDCKISNTNRTLFDALVYVAACHAVGIPGIREGVLADLLAVERDWVQTLVVNPLGEEAAAVRSAGHVSTRHSKVAKAILVAAEQAFGIDISEVWSAIVRQTFEMGKDERVGESYAKILHAGPILLRELPHQFTKQRRKDIAVAVASTSAEIDANRLSFLVGLGRTYRIAEDYAAAVQVFREHFDHLSTKVDYKTDVRGYWYEWGIAEGAAIDEAKSLLANAWLAGLSLADHLKPAPITFEMVGFSCSGLGVAFGGLAKPHPECPFARARRAVAYLGKQAKPNALKLGYFKKHDIAADMISTPYPASNDEAIDWLTVAVAQAGRELQDPLLKTLLTPEQVSFNMLRNLFSPAQPARLNRREGSPLPTPVSQPTIGLKQLLLQQVSNLDDRVKAGIQRVLSWAWEGVPDTATPDERFNIAKKRAGQSINGLSPKIKSRVRIHFESLNWEPLKECDPKR